MIRRIQSFVCCLAGLASAAFAKEAPYVLLGEGHLVNEPYRWTLLDGTPVNKGQSDAAGRAFLVQVPDKTDYVLELLWGSFKVKVPAKCWSGAPKDFQSCAQWSPREAPQQAEAPVEKNVVQEGRDRRRANVAWVSHSLSPAQQVNIIDAALADQRKWLKTPAAELNVTTFSCRKLSLPNPSAEASRSFEEARNLPLGRGQSLAYAKAAELGHWRAAARIVSISLDDEDWESAASAIAWLLSRDVPAGYNRLADWLEAQGSYDGDKIGGGLKGFSTSLRWRAAQAGDPVAQSLMSHYFADLRRQDVADALIDCARQQNPEIR